MITGFLQVTFHNKIIEFLPIVGASITDKTLEVNTVTPQGNNKTFSFPTNSTIQALKFVKNDLLCGAMQPIWTEDDIRQGLNKYTRDGSFDSGKIIMPPVLK